MGIPVQINITYVVADLVDCEFLRQSTRWFIVVLAAFQVNPKHSPVHTLSHHKGLMMVFCCYYVLSSDESLVYLIYYLRLILPGKVVRGPCA